MFQLATQLKKRSMLWIPFGASSGRWPFTRTTNTEPRKVGPAWHTLHGWGKRMAGTKAMPLPPKSRTKFHNSVLFGKQVISVFIKPVLAQPARGRLVIWWVSQGCGLHGVTTKLTSVKRGRTRKSSSTRMHGGPRGQPSLWEFELFTRIHPEQLEQSLTPAQKEIQNFLYSDFKHRMVSQTCQQLVRGPQGARCRARYKRGDAGGMFSFQESET